MDQPIQAQQQAAAQPTTHPSQTGGINTTGMGFDKTVSPTEQPPIAAHKAIDLQQVWQKNSGFIKLLLLVMLVNLLVIMFFV